LVLYRITGTSISVVQYLFINYNRRNKKKKIIFIVMKII